MTDNELNQLAVRYQQARGNRDAYFTQIINELDQLIHYLAWRYTVPGRDRDDLIQIARLSILQSIDKYDPERGDYGVYASCDIRSTYLALAKSEHCAKRLTINHAMSFDAEPIPEASMHAVIGKNDIDHSTREYRDTFWRSLGMTQFERNVLLRHLQRFSYAEISQQLSISKKSVDNALSRIRNKAGLAAQQWIDDNNDVGGLFV